MTPPDRQRWCVVGAGLVGLTMAHRLAQAGHDVTLLERADAIGGLAAAWQVGPVMWDKHYHVTLASDASWRAVLDELGLDAEMRWKSTRTACLADGQLLPVSTPLEFARFRPLSLAQRVRLGLTVLYAGRVRDGTALEDVPVEKWLTRLSGRRGFERFWKPLLQAKLGTAYGDASAAFIWATAQRLSRARRSGIGDEKFGFVPGGYARILSRFEARLRSEGVALRLGVGIESIESIESVGGSPAVPGVVLADGSVEVFDHVVATTSASTVSRLVPGLSESEHERLRSLRYQGVVCVSLVLRKPLSPYYLTYLLDDTILTGVVDMSSLVDADQLDGHGLVYLPRYVASDDPMLSMADDEIIERFTAELVRVDPSFDREDVVAARVSKVREVFSVPTLGYSAKVLPFDTSMPGVHVVHGAQIVNGTLNVDESVALAERAIDHLGVRATVAIGESSPLPVAPSGSPDRSAGSPVAPAASGRSVPRPSRTPEPASHLVSQERLLDPPAGTVASLSLDLDNEWAYRMTHGDPEWQSFPTYLDVVVPHVLEALRRLDLRITFFVVGQDAASAVNREPLQMLSAAGHEIANHSFRHQPWLHLYSDSEIHEELARAEDAIEVVTGQRTLGFRGPGYSLSPSTLEALVRRGYRYDASTLPTVLGPVARAYYFRSAKLTAEQRAERSLLFGTWRDGLRPLRPYRWRTSEGAITELPVSTFPGVRVPIHISYLLYLAQVRPLLARTYFATALRTCRTLGVEPSILLHPLDFLGGDDVASLSFFPGMAMPGVRKRELVEGWLAQLAATHRVVTMIDHVEAIERSGPLPERSAASMRVTTPAGARGAGGLGGTVAA